MIVKLTQPQNPKLLILNKIDHPPFPVHVHLSWKKVSVKRFTAGWSRGSLCKLRWSRPQVVGLQGQQPVKLISTANLLEEGRERCSGGLWRKRWKLNKKWRSERMIWEQKFKESKVRNRKNLKCLKQKCLTKCQSQGLIKAIWMNRKKTASSDGIYFFKKSLRILSS